MENYAKQIMIIFKALWESPPLFYICRVGTWLWKTRSVQEEYTSWYYRMFLSFREGTGVFKRMCLRWKVQWRCFTQCTCRYCITKLFVALLLFLSYLHNVENFGQPIWNICYKNGCTEHFATCSWVTLYRKQPAQITKRFSSTMEAPWSIFWIQIGCRYSQQGVLC